MKRFNVTGICVPEEDYMVDISGKIAEIKKLIDNGSYFTINRGRQYGKTTTLYGLRKRLRDEYLSLRSVFRESAMVIFRRKQISVNPLQDIYQKR